MQITFGMSSDGAEWSSKPASLGYHRLRHMRQIGRAHV